MCPYCGSEDFRQRWSWSRHGIIDGYPRFVSRSTGCTCNKCFRRFIHYARNENIKRFSERKLFSVRSRGENGLPVLREPRNRHFRIVEVEPGGVEVATHNSLL